MAHASVHVLVGTLSNLYRRQQAFECEPMAVYKPPHGLLSLNSSPLETNTSRIHILHPNFWIWAVENNEHRVLKHICTRNCTLQVELLSTVNYMATASVHMCVCSLYNIYSRYTAGILLFALSVCVVRYTLHGIP